MSVSGESKVTKAKLNFSFKGTIPASKSMMNRALIARLYEPGLQIEGQSSCEDVTKMTEGVAALKQGQDMDCGSAGTVFRFLTMAAARQPGRHFLKASARLLSRPQATLIQILNQLGVKVESASGGITVTGEGWQDPKAPIIVDRSQSSQFATGLLINAWELDFPLYLAWQGEVVSEGYWQMSLEMMKHFGMGWDEDTKGMSLNPGQKLKPNLKYRVESDLSSSFAVAAIAGLLGRGEFNNYPFSSLQPDAVFVNFLRKMGAKVEAVDGSLKIHKAMQLKPLEANLLDCPDLFPVLAVLCAFADGSSTLFGAPHLVYKESNRITKTAELITAIGRQVEIKSDGMIIHGKSLSSDQSAVQASTQMSAPAQTQPSKNFDFDPDQDHRLAFAAALANRALGGIVVTDPTVVNKSFPEFWTLIDQSH